jgi:antirestriction protein ArdC
MSKTDEIYERVTNSIVSAIESGDDLGSWKAPWHGSSFLPTNATTLKPYSGGNVIVLWATQLDSAYPTATWATYKQWESIGAQVRKGERGTGLIKWSSVIDRKTAHLPESDQRTTMIPNAFTVFNAAQVDGFTPPTPPADVQPIEHAAAFFSNINATIIEGEPAYSPVSDVILLPNIKQFDSAPAYYATSAHEHAHWSGAPHRLNRELSTKFGSEAYAFEELVAELSAAFTSAHLGISTIPRADHARYLKHWASILRSDPKAIYSAASLAQKATDYLIGLQ